MVYAEGVCNYMFYNVFGPFIYPESLSTTLFIPHHYYYTAYPVGPHECLI